MKKLMMILGLVFMIGLVAETANAQRRTVKKEVVIVRGKRVKKLTRQHVVVAHRSTNYRYYNGVFYRPAGREFVVVSAPIGIRVRVLPARRIKVRVRGSLFFYFNGTFYRQTEDFKEYEVIAPPIGAIVPSLPEGHEMVIIDGKKYFELDGYYYKEAIIDNSLKYEVVGKEVGLVTN